MEQDIFVAAARGDVETLQAILTAKPNAGAAIRGCDGSTPVLLAAFAGHREAVELLLRSPGVCTRRHLNYLRRNGTSMLWWLAQEGGRAPLITRLLSLTLDDMHSDDHARVARNAARRAKWEAERRGETGTEDAGGGSAVGTIASTLWGLTTKISSLVLGGGGAAAAEAEAEAEAKAAAEREKRRKKKPPPPPPFVHEGMGRHLVMPDRGFPEDSRETPLMAAIMRGDEASVLALLQGPLGANVNAMTIGGGMTPLHCCALEGRASMIPLLLERDADPFVRNQDGETPKELALAQGHHACAQLLEEAEEAARAAKPTGLPYLCMLAAQGRYDDIKEALEEAKVQVQEQAKVQAQEEAGGGQAVGVGKKAVAAAAAAMLNQARPYTGETLLHVAARSGEKGAEQVIRLLLHYGTQLKVDLGDRFGCTPLYYAALANRLPIVKALIEKHRANPLLGTRDGDSAWLVAGQWAHLDEDGGQQRDNRAIFYAMEPRVDEIEDEQLAAEDGEGDAAAPYATGLLQSECASPSFQSGGAGAGAGPSKKKKRKKKKKGGAGAGGAGGGEEEGEEGDEMDVEGREAFDKEGGREGEGALTITVVGADGVERVVDARELELQEQQELQDEQEVLKETWEYISRPFRPLPPVRRGESLDARRARVKEEAARDPEVLANKDLLNSRVNRNMHLEEVDDPLQEAIAKCLLRAMVVLEQRMEEGPEKEMLVKGGHHLLRIFADVLILVQNFKHLYAQLEANVCEGHRIIRKTVDPTGGQWLLGQQWFKGVKEATEKAVSDSVKATMALRALEAQHAQQEQEEAAGGLSEKRREAQRKKREEERKKQQREVDTWKRKVAIKTKELKDAKGKLDDLKTAHEAAKRDLEAHQAEKEKPLNKEATKLMADLRVYRRLFNDYAASFMVLFGEKVLEAIETAPELREVKEAKARAVEYALGTGHFTFDIPLCPESFRGHSHLAAEEQLRRDPLVEDEAARLERLLAACKEQEAAIAALRAREERAALRAAGVTVIENAGDKDLATLLRELGLENEAAALAGAAGLPDRGRHGAYAGGYASGGSGYALEAQAGGARGGAGALDELDDYDDYGDAAQFAKAAAAVRASRGMETRDPLLESLARVSDAGSPLDAAVREVVDCWLLMADHQPGAQQDLGGIAGMVARDAGVEVDAMRWRAGELFRALGHPEAGADAWADLIFGDDGGDSEGSSDSSESTAGGEEGGQEGREARGENEGDRSLAERIMRGLGPHAQPLDRLVCSVIAEASKYPPREVRRMVAQELSQMGASPDAARRRATELLLGAGVAGVDADKAERWARQYFVGGEVFEI